jgi:hypothetical protein
MSGDKPSLPTCPDGVHRDSSSCYLYQIWLRKIFGPKRDEVIGEWRKLHNEELNDLYCDKIKKNEMGGACSANGGGERRVQGFGGKI